MGAGSWPSALRLEGARGGPSVWCLLPDAFSKRDDWGLAVMSSGGHRHVSGVPSREHGTEIHGFFHCCGDSHH